MATQNVTGFVLTVYGVWRNGQSVAEGELLISWQSEEHRLSLSRQSEHKESDSGNANNIFPRSLCLWISGQHHLHSVTFRLQNHECSLSIPQRLFWSQSMVRSLVLHRRSLDDDESTTSPDALGVDHCTASCSVYPLSISLDDAETLYLVVSFV